ncbi:MAG: cell wall hydrolase [Firmicutes bacterium]|nr:cell wall hydrolase [Bacillota bacterium]
MAYRIKKICLRLKCQLENGFNQIEQWVISNRRILSDLKRIVESNKLICITAALVVALSTGIALAGPVYTAAKTKESTKKNKPRGTENSSINRDDRYLMARVIEGEAADEPLKGKVAVGAVVINRVESGKFPRSISQVVYQPLAFEAVMNGQYNRPVTRESLRAADLALEGWDPTNGALYYWNPEKAQSRWVWQRPVTMQIGRHVFAM